MKQLLSSTALAVVLGAAAISAAKADIISLEAADGGPNLTFTGLSGNGTSVSGSGSTTNFNVSISGSSDFSSNPTNVLNGATIDAQDLSDIGVQTLTIYITAQGLLAPLGLVSGLTQDFTWTNVPAQWTVSEAMYIDPNNGQFTTVDQLGATQTLGPCLNVNGCANATQVNGQSFVNTNNPFSLTEVFTITAQGGGSTNDGMDLLAPTSSNITGVPGPLAGAGIPGLVFAFGGMMAWWRRRRPMSLDRQMGAA